MSSKTEPKAGKQGALGFVAGVLVGRKVLPKLIHITYMALIIAVALRPSMEWGRADLEGTVFNLYVGTVGILLGFLIGAQTREGK